MINKYLLHKELYNKIVNGENVVPASRQEAFDLALVMKLIGVMSDIPSVDKTIRLSKYEQLYLAIVNGEDVTPMSKDEAFKLAIINSHGGSGSGVTANLSNYYKKSQTYSSTQIDEMLGKKVDSTKITEVETNMTNIQNNYAKKTYVTELINKIEGLTRKIVTVLPEVSEADETILYMLKVTESDDDRYDMYMKIEGEMVHIGNTTIKLDEYAKVKDIHTHTNKEILDKVTQKIIDNSHTHGNKETIDKFSVDSEGNLKYNESYVNINDEPITFFINEDGVLCVSYDDGTAI